jgi:hypothetical protein
VLADRRAADRALLYVGLAAVAGIGCKEAHVTNSKVRGPCPGPLEERE